LYPLLLQEEKKVPFDFSKELFYVRVKKFWPFYEYGTEGVTRGLKSVAHGEMRTLALAPKDRSLHFRLTQLYPRVLPSRDRWTFACGGKYALRAWHLQQTFEIQATSSQLHRL
jgi:hypothetical protein